MNKAKQKRIRKELDKTYQTGHYWEWLRIVEQAGLVASFGHEWEEVWKKVAQRSLRLPRHFQEFFGQIGSFKQVPDIPDLTLLRLVQQHLEGNPVQQELSALGGLSPSGKVFREKALSWKENLFPQEKALRVLTQFISQPAKIDQKHYNQLADLIPGTDIALYIRGLGEGMKSLRKVTGPSGLKRTVREEQLKALRRLDLDVEEFAPVIPSNLFSVLLFPFIGQLAHFFKVKSLRESTSRLAEVVSALPFLFDRLAGERATAIKGHLLGFKAQRSSTQALAVLTEQASKAGFEGKVGLLGQIRTLIRNHPATELLDLFLRIYKEVLVTIAEKAAGLPLRQKRELPRVLGPVIGGDIEILWQDELLFADFSRMADFLEAIGQAGCLDRKLALLSLIVAEKARNKGLKTIAFQCLAGPERVSSEELKWVLTSMDEMVFPFVGLLRPLTGFFSNDPEMLALLGGYILNHLEYCLIQATKDQGLRNPFMIDYLLMEDFQKIIAMVRAEISGYKEDPVFAVILEFLNCFPKNMFTIEGYYAFLALSFEKNRDLIPILAKAGEINRKITGKKEIGFIKGQVLEPDSIHFFKLKIFQRFILNHLNALKEIPLEKMEEVIVLAQEAFGSNDLKTFISRLSNILADRVKKGEKEAGLWKNRVLEILVRLKRRA